MEPLGPRARRRWRARSTGRTNRRASPSRARLHAERRPLAERPAVRLLAHERHHRGPQRRSRSARGARPRSGEVGGPQVARAGRRPQGGVRDPDAVPEQVALLAPARARAASAPRRGAAARSRCAGSRSAPRRPPTPARVDADQHQPEPGRRGRRGPRSGGPRHRPSVVPSAAAAYPATIRLEMPHVMTVLGPVDPSTLGFILPHEHTQIARCGTSRTAGTTGSSPRDEPVILEELARYREAGGATLVDLTVPGVGRDPRWLARLSEQSGLHLVMGGGWYRTAYYPPETLIDRRSVDSLAEELVREATVGRRATPAMRIGILGEIGTDKPWVTPAEERVFRAVARASRRTGPRGHDPRGAVRRGRRAADDPRGGGRGAGAGRDRARGQLPGPGPLAVADRPRRHRSSSTSSGCRSRRPRRRARAGSSTCCWSCSTAATPTGCCSARTCATTASSATTRATATRTCRTTFLPRLRERGVSEAEIDQLTIANPRRVLTIR